MVWAGLGCSEGSTALPVVAVSVPAEFASALPEPERPGPDWSEPSRPGLGYLEPSASERRLPGRSASAASTADAEATAAADGEPARRLTLRRARRRGTGRSPESENCWLFIGNHVSPHTPHPPRGRAASPPVRTALHPSPQPIPWARDPGWRPVDSSPYPPHARRRAGPERYQCARAPPRPPGSLPVSYSARG